MSVRLNFWVVNGVLVDKQHTQTLVDMEEKGELEGLSLVYTDPMSDSDIIVGKVVYRYTEELDDELAGKAVPFVNTLSFIDKAKLIKLKEVLGIGHFNIEHYALTELS